MGSAYDRVKGFGGFVLRLLFWTSGPPSIRKGLVNGLLLEVYLVAFVLLLLGHCA